MKLVLSCIFFISSIILLGGVETFGAARQPIQYPFYTPYSHYADDENIDQILTNFAHAQGYSSVCTPEVKGSVSGRFEAISPKEFLDGMASAFGVRWYTQGKTVTFYNNNEKKHEFLMPTTVSAERLRQMLQSSGLVSPQLPLSIVDNQSLLSVNGPPIYIDQLRSAMIAYETVQGKRIEMRVFPLQYAWAEDKNLNSMDTVVTIPGVASILNEMVNGSPTSRKSGTKVLPSAQKGLLGQGLSAMGGNQSNPNNPSNQNGQIGEELDIPRIVADPRVNSVIITDVEYRMDYYKKVIADLDKPVQLVEIHAAIVDIDSKFTREFGVTWSGNLPVGKHTRSGGEAGGEVIAAGTIPTAGEVFSGGLDFSTIYTKGVDYFMARVQALETDGDARVLGKPSVLTIDNVQATLENTNTYYIPVSGYQSQDLFKVDSGTVLKVTPHIIPGENGFDSIKLMINVQDNRDSGEGYFSVDTKDPQPLRETKINTQAIVSVGQSLLIGGYYYETQQETDAGIPGLKNIPVLGYLFGSKQKKHQRMERLILITPRIIRLETSQPIPGRIDDPRFSRSPTQADYFERPPKSRPVGGCFRRSELNPPAPEENNGVRVSSSPAAAQGAEK